MALLTVLFVASPGAAQEAVDLYGQTEATLTWDPASGPVTGYWVVVSRNDGTPAVDAVVNEARATIQAELGESIVVTVNAFDESGLPGPPSAPSPVIRFNAESEGGGSGDPPPSDGGDPPPAEEEPPPSEEEPPSQPPVVARAVTHDFTGNGTSDLVLPGSNGLALWSLDPSTGPQELPLPQQDASWRHVGSGDLDGNGAVDLVFEHDLTGDVVMLLFADGEIIAGGLLPLTEGSATERWSVVGTGDLNGDGRDDLVRRSNQRNLARLVFMQGMDPNGSMEIAAAPGETKVAAIEDLDGDGVDEIVWIDEATQTLTLWDMHGDGAETATLAQLGDGWKVIGAGDFDGDGAADLFAHHAGAGPIEAWRINGATIVETLSLPNAAGATPMHVSDFDGDALADIALVDDGTQEIVGWFSDGAGVSEGLLLAAEAWNPAPPDDGEPVPPDADEPPVYDLEARLCAADVNGDGRFTKTDLHALQDCDGRPATGSCAFGDLDGDGSIGNGDFEIFGQHYKQRVCEPTRVRGRHR